MSKTLVWKPEQDVKSKVSEAKPDLSTEQVGANKSEKKQSKKTMRKAIRSPFGFLMIVNFLRKSWIGTSII